MARNEQGINASESDKAEVKPELDAAWFEEADAYLEDRLVRRGRPPSDNPKRAIALLLDPEVVDWFKRSGPGWQSRMKAALRTAAGL